MNERIKIGCEIHKFAKELWPLNRSITGDGVRQTLERIKFHLPELQIESINSGTSVFDWIIPREWSVNEAYIVSPSGERICDFRVNNLHLLGYSIPFEGKIKLKELKSTYIRYQINQMLSPILQVTTKSGGVFAYLRINTISSKRASIM